MSEVNHEKEALKCLKAAVKGLDNVGDELLSVSECLGETPESDRIESIRRDLENLWCDLNGLMKNLERRVG